MLVLTFQIGDTPLAIDIRRVREVVPRVFCSASTAAPIGKRASSFIVAKWCPLSTCIAWPGTSPARRI